MTLSTIPSPITIPAILTFAISSGVVTAIMNQGILWWREAQHDSASTKRDARYLAIRLAVMLEKFAIQYADRIADNEMYRDNDGYAAGNLRYLG